MKNWAVVFIFFLSVQSIWATSDLCSTPNANISQQSSHAQKIENASIVTCAQRNQAKSTGLEAKEKQLKSNCRNLIF